jgi:hypothetical protein
MLIIAQPKTHRGQFKLKEMTCKNHFTPNVMFLAVRLRSLLCSRWQTTWLFYCPQECALPVIAAADGVVLS